MTESFLTEQALLAEKLRLRASLEEVEELHLLDFLIKHAPIGFVLFDRDLRYVRINERLAEFNGVPAEMHIGRSVTEIVPSLAETVREMTDRILATGQAICDQEFVGETSLAPGVRRYWNTSWYPVRGKNEEIIGFGALAEEVSERKQAEIAGRASDERLRLFIENAPAGVAQFDREMRYVAATRRWKEDYDLPGDFVGRSHYEVHPDLPERWKEVHRRALAGELLRSEADIYEYADGRVQWVNWETLPWRTSTGEIGGILIAAQDITARVRSERALRESEERLQLALNAAHLISFEWDIRRNAVIRFQSANSAFPRTARDEKITFEEVVEVVHPEDRALFQANVAAALEHPDGHYQNEFRVVRPDGSIAWHSESGLVEHDPERRPLRLIGLSRDITSQKLIQKQIVELNKELESRVVERTCELQAAVHALAAEIAERRRLEREVLSISEREQTRIGRQLHDGVCQSIASAALRLDLEAKKIGGKKSESAARVREIAQLLREHVILTRQIATSLIPARIEQNGLESALTELAAETQEQSSIECSFQMRKASEIFNQSTAIHLYRIAQEAISNAVRHGQARTITMELGSLAGTVSLSICDDGSGMPKTPTTSGLGLHTMEYRARALGGTLVVADRVGGGTTVTCSFPEKELASPGSDGTGVASQ